MIIFSNTKISSHPTKTGRVLVYTDIELNNEIYKWGMYVPALTTINLGEYLESNSSIYENDILKKEALWGSMDKTEEIENPGGDPIIVDIPKDRIVKPDIPDYEEKLAESGEEIKSLKRLLNILTKQLSDNEEELTEQLLHDLSIVSDTFIREGKLYKVGDRFNYNGDLYKVLQQHTSQSDWFPNELPALYKKVPLPGTIPDWVQPLGGHDTYQIGNKVKHNGFTWECTVGDNVWEPGVYGWIQI